MAGHLLVLEGFARILPLPGRAEAAMRYGNAMRRAQPAEIPALHAAGKALAYAGAGHINILPGDEMRRGDLGTDIDKRVLGDAKLGELCFRLDLGFSEMAALGLSDILDLGGADPELQRGVAVRLLRALGDDLTIGDAQHGYRDVVALAGEYPGHPELLRNETGPHHDPLELDLDINAGGEIELHQRIDGLRRRIDDIEHPLMGADLELLARFLVDMRRAQHRELLDLGRQRDRPPHPRAGALGRVDDLARRLIEHAVVVGAQPNSDVLIVAYHLSCSPAAAISPGPPASRRHAGQTPAIR